VTRKCLQKGGGCENKALVTKKSKKNPPKYTTYDTLATRKANCSEHEEIVDKIGPFVPMTLQLALIHLRTLDVRSFLRALLWLFVGECSIFFIGL
jgi:hypothetical protein